jgi:hypothetical protein
MTSTRKSNQAFLRYARFVLLAMIICLGVMFFKVGIMMGEHHEKHVAQVVEDHPAMKSHTVGTEPLQVRLILSQQHQNRIIGAS